MPSLFYSIDFPAFFLSCSRIFRSVPDRISVKVLRFVTFLIVLVSGPSLLANPFQKLQQEINESLPNSDSTVFRLFGNQTQEQEVQKLFSVGVNQTGEEEEVELASLDLPKYINVSPVVSNTVVHESGIVVKKYTVQKKDNLSKIARSFSIDVAKLKKANSLTSDQLKIGQVLEVPVQVKNASSSRVVLKKIFILPVPQSRVTSRFGRRVDPFNKYNRVYHSGLDLAAKVGAPVLSAADGEVVFTGRNGGYGNSVTIQHKNGYKTVYAHCSQILVEVGETVKMGRVVALVGRTGTATGAHLHFEVFRNGKIMNPESALGMTEKHVTKLPKSEVAGM
ncbi:LysM peptidoglycan-binding domain-containing protein [Leptospira kemamanensis]|uniref:LysM peptidoglycan-binding domain-containing protein n=1 Tax=Leptospira kemamanensis TaxID=2484942 RepID=A0A4R9JSV6_9LEPT|nr:LysM peptidoglycan-binding domain-containing protein [Leptospira kemamanensis]